MYKIVGIINYIVVIFLNAFTDLGHKIIIQNTIFKVYDGDMLVVLTAVINALILLPFILIFSPSGFLADRFPKNKIMEYSSVFAIVITLAITYSYYNGLFVVAFIMTFMLALQSAIYGPAKYGYIKELVGEKYISSGNAAIQATTTVAILGGIIFYTVLFEGRYNDTLENEGQILKAIAPIGWLLVASSIIEWFYASKLPNKMKEASTRTFKLKRYLSGAYLKKNMKMITRKREIFDAIIALSLFWSISQVVLAIFGEYAKSNLGVTNTIYVQGVMALAGIGIVVGSVLASKYSKYYINLGLVGLGASGLTVVVFLVPFVDSMVVLAPLFMLFGVFSGFLMVPLNARIQLLSPRVHLGIILAGNNFIQNIFMFTFLALTTVFAYNGMDTEILFYLMGMVGLYLSFMTLKHYFVETFWAKMLIISSLRHKYVYHGLQNVPTDSGALLLCNHVSWLDWIILQLPFKRHLNYMMEKDIYNWPFFHTFFKKGEAIPISSRASKDAFKEAHKRLLDEKLVAIFPEGQISTDGKLTKFRRGYELIPSDYDGSIIPVFIDGVFGSLFSRYKKSSKKYFWKRRVIHVYYGTPISNGTNAQEVREVIQMMKDKYETK
ncbi:MFS transporter [Sulfurimonas sp. SAG-AH-194-C20]|nr:MFS transporter [Sulfurimonas sp. SAG-AH-194-C20]MDF1879468.1 MFS transporter [Sulfurimonas sp. SAG-AH-194-C20]